MVEGGMKCVKYILFAFNLTFFVSIIQFNMETSAFWNLDHIFVSLSQHWDLDLLMIRFWRRSSLNWSLWSICLVGCVWTVTKKFQFPKFHQISQILMCFRSFCATQQVWFLKSWSNYLGQSKIIVNHRIRRDIMLVRILVSINGLKFW